MLALRLGLHEAIQRHHPGQRIGTVDHALSCLVLQHVAELVLRNEHGHRLVCANEQGVGLHDGWLTAATPEAYYSSG